MMAEEYYDGAYTGEEIDAAVAAAFAAAPQSTTYTKDDVDSALSGKADASHTHTMGQITDIGAAAAKGFDPTPTSGNTNNAVSSDGVYQAIDGLKMEYYQVITSVVDGASHSTSTTYDRKVSDYDMLIFTVGYNSFRGSIIVPTNLFKMWPVYLQYIRDGVMGECDFSYVDETHIQVSSAVDASQRAIVYGIKIETS